MKTILITGATGMIGREVVKACHARNYKVHYLTTSKSKLSDETNYKGFYWNPSENEIDHSCLQGVDAIINLVGASISKRWTDSYKREILTSRTETAKLLVSTIKANNYPIKHVVSASAIGIYPSSMTNYYEEGYNEKSSSFLGEVVAEWESAVEAFSELGITVAKIRIGLVLSMHGGALPEIAKPAKFGAGAAFGTGEQWQSWIHVNDLAEMFLFAVDNNLEGIYNGVAPNPMTNGEVTKAVAKTLHKPLILPNIPKVAMKLVLGEMHMLLFESQRVCAAKIENAGFEFKFHHLEPALLDLFS
ncbi:TIGR01777 family oxidoreductase [Psychroserpens sp.]|uniref:TIGR01777 family oxidoreductase n=1 Tax=Psychroserpens sp. TaxID=2020870 RepID=UPI001B18437E|nr:TIGR01777 family oxidoreductase [Psychroserpens sp.]MBO6607599.1 TIGR01777 family oxidoreductase [Psychroserpens sp.]MBO6631573.1 TIGR01777 family oxidoreductase [Psychroserpens sp.]MBO6655089.1 TIGR01777 family oxidoreductase [Psychroserpens sp.]MBO6683106.1 TIGR01777 family oxidoreductase [Psychroserpens sp.]MBO6749715.1 TIGR01777 family oxidoreductase [Psychroserpens sp.]